MRRKQFPIKPAFAVTANKSQGQTFDKIGAYLTYNLFSHGQLYVATSKIGSKDNLNLWHPSLTTMTMRKPIIDN